MSEVTTDSPDTAHLLDQARTGDRQAFERLFGRYRTYLRRVIALRLDPNLRPRVDPSDVVQETHLEAYRRLPDFLERRPMPFRLWLRKTAQERLLVVRRQHLQAARRSVGREVPLSERSSLLLAQYLRAPGLSPSEQADRHELARRVRTALGQLPEADQEVLLMRVFEGLSNMEVGHVLGIDPGTASKRHGRALLRLHKILAEGGLRESST
jgi:RNA polymerase sigma-70 factor (ECF subfamily)